MDFFKISNCLETKSQGKLLIKKREREREREVKKNEKQHVLLNTFKDLNFVFKTFFHEAIFCN